MIGMADTGSAGAGMPKTVALRSQPATTPNEFKEEFNHGSLQHTQ